MRRDRTGAFAEALLGDRRPKRLDAAPEEAAVLRTAVTLRAARPGAGTPDERFVADLQDRLAAQAQEGAPIPVATTRPPRRRAALVGIAAAAIAVVGGTVAVTHAVDSSSQTPGPQVALAGSLRVANLQSADGRRLGQVSIHRGNPSWLFMSMRDPGVEGSFSCELRLHDGTTMRVGTVQVRDGAGQLAGTVAVDPSRLTGARLVAPTGATLASASF